MDYSTFEQTMEQIRVPEGVEALSVYGTLEQVSDGRHKRGVRYSVALVLTLILLAKLAGMTTPLAIAEWVRLRADWLHTVLPTRRQSFPCAATSSNVLRAVDAEQGNALLTATLTRVRATERCGEEPSRLMGQAEREEHVHVAASWQDPAGDAGP
jgi:DDE_Tnp_1-associated